MSNIFAALNTAGNAMDALQDAMSVVQNNVANASTPDYVTQRLDLNAKSFDLDSGLTGGVQAGAVTSSRNTYAEEAVWNQNAAVGTATEQASSLSSLQSAFDITGTSGIPAGLSSLYTAFSAWSNSPDDSTARQQVLNAANQLAQAFNSAAASVQQVSTQTEGALKNTVTQINQLTGQIVTLNDQIRRSGGTQDPGLDSQLYSDLEQLSNLTGITVRNESDGTVTVLMGGQTPLVIGTTQTQLKVGFAQPANATNANAAPDVQILTTDGQDVTSNVSQGQIAGLLQFRNVTVASLIGNGVQQGSLNQLAQTIADRVNTLLTSGQTPTGQSGTALFTYSGTAPTSIASTFAVNPAIDASQLAAIDPGPPTVANGIADALAQLQSPTSASDMLNGMSYLDFYSGIASNIGTQASTASTAQTASTQLLNQAQSTRAQLTGVSLNEQATLLVQYQQSYEAAAQMITVISNTINYLMSAMQQVS